MGSRTVAATGPFPSGVPCGPVRRFVAIGADRRARNCEKRPKSLASKQNGRATIQVIDWPDPLQASRCAIIATSQGTSWRPCDIMLLDEARVGRSPKLALVWITGRAVEIDRDCPER